MKENRVGLDEALANMFSNPSYAPNYLFYAHMIGQTSIRIRKDLPAAAGVSFNNDHYNLYINSELFDKFDLEGRLSVLKHEMLHILNGHVSRTQDRKHLPWNYSTDCAINQLIDRKHLPDGCIYPDTFPVPNTPTKKHSELYYDLLKEQADKENKEKEEKEDCDKCDGSGEQDKEPKEDGEDSEDGESEEDGGKEPCDKCKGSGKEPGEDEEGEGQGGMTASDLFKEGQNDEGQGQHGNMDTHETWQESIGDEDLQKDITKNMIEKSINETQKSRGNLPGDIEDMLNMFTRTIQVNWRQVLRKIQGNKKVNSRRTIMRSDRRFPKREDLRGKTKDRMFTTVVGVDVSGSMSTEEILLGLNEIHAICKMTNSDMKLIQIDTRISGITDFDKNTKIFNRTAGGGTYMGACPDYIMENRLECDVLVMISDMYIEEVPKDDIWNKFKKKVIWLNTSDAKPDWHGWRKHSIYPIDLGEK